MSMERRRQNNASGRWNTAQFLRSIEESQFEEAERSRPVESTQGRSLVSRFGMSEISCFPSSRSRRSSDSQQQDDTRRRSASQKRGSVPQLRSADTNRMGTSSRQQDRGKNQVFPRSERSGLMIRTNELAAFDETTQDCFAAEGETSNHYNHSDSEHFDSEDQIFDLTLVDEAALEGDRLHAFKTFAGSSSCKRKSYGVSARSGNNISGSENSSTRDDHQHRRGSSLRRSSSSAPTTLRSSSAFANPVEGARPQKIRVSGSAVDAAAVANSRPTYTPGSRGVTTTPQPAEYHGLMNCHLEQQSASASRPSCLLNSSSRSRRSEEARRFSPSLTSRSGRGEGSSSSYRFSSSASRLNNHDGGEPSNASSGIVTRRNLSSCFRSQGRRSETSRQVAFAGSDSRRSGNSSVGARFPDFASSSSSSSTQTPVSVLASGLEVMPSAASGREQQRSSSVASPEMNWSSSSSATGFGWEYHRPRLMAEGLAKILVALERVDELTHEQLLMLEATVLFGGMALHDQHRDWRMDVDNMSYEELLDLGDRIGSVNTGLNKELVSARLRKITFSSLKHRLSRCSDEYESKCSICQEEYEDGERLGWIDCGHQYHAHCITEWLVQKNICPICKATALPQ